MLIDLSDLCFVVPIAPIPCCFDGRFVILLGSYYITLIAPEMVGLTVKLSRAGPSSDPSRFLYPTLVFFLPMTYIPLIHTSVAISPVSLSSLLPNSTPLACAIDQTSHRPIRFLQLYTSTSRPECPPFILLHVPFLFPFRVWPRLSSFFPFR